MGVDMVEELVLLTSVEWSLINFGKGYLLIVWLVLVTPVSIVYLR